MYVCTCWWFNEMGRRNRNTAPETIGKRLVSENQKRQKKNRQENSHGGFHVHPTFPIKTRGNSAVVVYMIGSSLHLLHRLERRARAKWRP